MEDYFTFDEEKELAEEELELTPSQTVSLNSFKDWIRGLEQNGLKKAFRLNGEAGTGKTYLMKQFIKVLCEYHITVAPIAFTGKAASRLMESTKCPSCTIHKLIYDFSGMSEFQYFESSDDETKAFDETKVLREVLNCKCLIIDEYSMLSKKMLQDLIDLNKILIFVGDLNQLSPIGEETITDEEFNAIFGYEVPTYYLTEPVRQGEYNPILTLARKVKNGLTSLGEYVSTDQRDTAKVIVSRDPKLDPKLFGRDECIIITHKNVTKNRLNNAVRKSLGHKDLIVPEDKIIIMKNDNDNRLYNGEMYRIVKVGDIRNELGFKYCNITIDRGTLERSIYQTFPIWLDPLETGNYSYKTTEELQKNKYEQFKMYKSLTQIAYGYAITCHKAQGSEWETVYIQLNDVTHDVKKWLYTALTRAKRDAIIKIR
jgi:exodeoxyribonuclease V